MKSLCFLFAPAMSLIAEKSYNQKFQMMQQKISKEYLILTCQRTIKVNSLGIQGKKYNTCSASAKYQGKYTHTNIHRQTHTHTHTKVWVESLARLFTFPGNKEAPLSSPLWWCHWSVKGEPKLLQLPSGDWYFLENCPVYLYFKMLAKCFPNVSCSIANIVYLYPLWFPENILPRICFILSQIIESVLIILIFSI